MKILFTNENTTARTHQNIAAVRISLNPSLRSFLRRFNIMAVMKMLPANPMSCIRFFMAVIITLGAIHG